MFKNLLSTLPNKLISPSARTFATLRLCVFALIFLLTALWWAAERNPFCSIEHRLKTAPDREWRIIGVYPKHVPASPVVVCLHNGSALASEQASLRIFAEHGLAGLIVIGEWRTRRDLESLWLELNGWLKTQNWVAQDKVCLAGAGRDLDLLPLAPVSGKPEISPAILVRFDAGETSTSNPPTSADLTARSQTAKAPAANTPTLTFPWSESPLELARTWSVFPGNYHTGGERVTLRIPVGERDFLKDPFGSLIRNMSEGLAAFFGHPPKVRVPSGSQPLLPWLVLVALLVVASILGLQQKLRCNATKLRRSDLFIANDPGEVKLHRSDMFIVTAPGQIKPRRGDMDDANASPHNCWRAALDSWLNPFVITLSAREREEGRGEVQGTHSLHSQPSPLQCARGQPWYRRLSVCVLAPFYPQINQNPSQVRKTAVLLPSTRWLYGVAAVVGLVALAETALHLGLPRLKISATTQPHVYRWCVPPAARPDFDFLTALPLWRNQSWRALLEHLELAQLTRRQFVPDCPDDFYRQWVLSPMFLEGNQTATDPEPFWRRLLWENCYPRIRDEHSPLAAARRVADYLAERITIHPAYAKENPGLCTLWEAQETDASGFKKLLVAALRSNGIPARITQANVEVWDTHQWSRIL